MPPKVPYGTSTTYAEGGNLLDDEVMEAVRAGRYEYQYPTDEEGNMLDLSPGSELHARIVGEIERRVRDASDAQQVRRDKYRKIDDKLSAFIDLDSTEQRIKREDDRKPVSIVLPVSYSILQTILSYWTSTFTNGDFIFTYEGSGPEDEFGALMLERVVDKHVQRRKMLLALHTMWRDAVAYGIGIVTPSWIRIVGKKSVPKVIGQQDLFNQGMFQVDSFERNVANTLLYEGNELTNIDVYRYFPDPSVPIHLPQEAEYIAWQDRTSEIGILEEEDASGGDIFNARYVALMQDARSSYYSESISKRDPIRDERGDTTDATSHVDRTYCYLKLIPQRWGLGKSKKVEKWLFVIAGDSIIIQAKPLNLDHNMFPVAVCAPEFDGHSSSAISLIELTFGMQETIDWLISSHITSVRKNLNGMWVINQYKVNMRDMERPGHGKFLRLRRAALDTPVGDVVQMIDSRDVTINHLSDITYMMDVINRVTGASDTVQGILPRKGEAKTAQEVRDSQVASLNRIETSARLAAVMAHTDIAYMFATHAQQFMSKDLYIKTVGERDEELRRIYAVQDKFSRVRPIDIQVDFDVVAKDGFTRGGEFIDAWTQVFQTLVQNPQIDPTIDITRVFRHLARLMGAKNISQFEYQDIQEAIAPDDIIQERIRSGRYIPVDQFQQGQAV